MSAHEDAPTPPPADEMVEVEADPIFGSDPWMRFDLWSSRLWESVETGVNIAIAASGEPGPMPVGAQASFCAAQFAQEIAEMVNPLSSDRGTPAVAVPSAAQTQAILELLLDDGDED